MKYHKLIWQNTTEEFSIQTKIVKYSPVIIALVIGIVLGIVIHILWKSKAKDNTNKFKLEAGIMYISLLGAAGCLIMSLLGESTVSIQILSFYTSFIFAWLLTKSSSRSEFKKMQHRVAKSTYRHIEDVETNVLITKKRIEECRKSGLTDGDIDGIVDDLNAILTGIRSNKDDWKDMLTKSYRMKIEGQEDPEGRLDKLKSPERAEIAKEFSEEIQKNSDVIKGAPTNE